MDSVRKSLDSNGAGGAVAATPIDALHMCAGLLSEVETGTPGAAFYSRLCEATCRLTSMRRAIIFMYDDARRRVEPAGAYNVDLDRFHEADHTLESAPMAERALAGDRVEEVSERFEDELPARYVDGLDATTLSCTPLSVGGRWFGVLFGDRPGPLGEPQRNLLWMIGKVVALAASARNATQAQERARELAARLDLSTEIHNLVVQRLFGVSLALAGEHPLTADERARCHSEVEAALFDLREALRSPVAPGSRPVVATLRDEVERLRREQPDLGLRLTSGDGVDVPVPLEPLAQSVLAEAVRNARRHAHPTRIDVSLARLDDTLVLEVVNDGAGQPGARGMGLGLRLASMEAAQHGGVVEFGRRDPGQWRVRLVVPVEVGS